MGRWNFRVAVNQQRYLARHSYLAIRPQLGMRYRLRTLLIVLGVAPPILAGIWFASPHLPTAILVAGMFAPTITLIATFLFIHSR
jgi:hypothetical protein